MQLNESTYETIFLLYIDNELSPKERLEVEAFIADNPNYALEMEALQATVLSSDKIQYPFKKNLKQQLDATSLEELEKDWNQSYATVLKADVESIPGLSTPFKNSLKKATNSEAIIVKSFGFNQNKFTYAAVAACLMIFLGYQQLTTTPAPDSVVAKNNVNLIPSAASHLVEDNSSNTSPKTFAKVDVLVPKIKQVQKLKAQAANAIKVQRINVIQQASFAMAESTPNISNINNQTVLVDIPRTYNNPITINAITNNAIETETESEENGPLNYEVIDTEDPNRTIFIANFEIDGNKLRGLKRKVTSLFKNNKSERNQ